MKRSWVPAAALGAVLLFSGVWTHAMERGQTADGRAFVAGGIGADETQALQAERTKYSLWVRTAANRSGAHLSGVLVTIVDARQRVVLERVLDGPWLLVDLPLGRYTVQASYAGEHHDAVTTIHAGDHHEVVLYFDVPAGVLPPAERAQ